MMQIPVKESADFDVSHGTRFLRIVIFEKDFEMLILSRRKDESIVLDGQIEIQVLKIKGNTVRLGIKAPEHIKVLRSELEVLIDETTLGDLLDSKTANIQTPIIDPHEK